MTDRESSERASNDELIALLLEDHGDDPHFVEAILNTFNCRTCDAELPEDHRGRCPYCGERP